MCAVKKVFPVCRFKIDSYVRKSGTNDWDYGID